MRNLESTSPPPAGVPAARMDQGHSPALRACGVHLASGRDSTPLGAPRSSGWRREHALDQRPSCSDTFHIHGPVDPGTVVQTSDQIRSAFGQCKQQARQPPTSLDVDRPFGLPSPLLSLNAGCPSSRARSPYCYCSCSATQSFQWLPLCRLIDVAISVSLLITWKPLRAEPAAAAGWH